MWFNHTLRHPKYVNGMGNSAAPWETKCSDQPPPSEAV